MEKVLKVNGMMCGGCERRAAKALNAIPGIEVIKADHEENIVIVDMAADVAEEAIETAVAEFGFEYAGMDD